MKKFLPFFGVFFFLIFLSPLLFPIEASAQSTGITISPVRIEDIVEPGQVLTRTLKVTNSSSNSQTLYPNLKDFKAEGESGTPVLIEPGTEAGPYMALWIEVAQDGVSFAPGEQKEINFNIKVPADVGPGGYYGAIYFGTKAPKLNINSEDKGAGIAVGQQNGALILLQVKGDVKEEMDIREFNTDKELYGTPFETKFMVRIENKSNVHEKPIGYITITNMFGKQVESIKFNSNGGNVMPNSTRRFEESWKGNMGFGRYFAELSLSYGTNVKMGGQGRQSLFSGKYFWIMPWRIIVPAGLSIVIVMALFALVIRLWKNKAVRRAMEQAGITNVRLGGRRRKSSPVAHMLMIIVTLLIFVFLFMTLFYFVFFA